MTSKAFELAQLSFGDNVKAEFGASSDLQIYHNGSDSYVDDTGSGALILRGNSNVTIGKYTGETMGYFEADGAAYLYHNNSIKMQTSSNGISVTGSDYQLRLNQGSNQPYYIRHASDNSLRMHLNGTGDRLTIDSGGALNGPPSANFDIKTGSGTGDMRFFVNGTQKFSIEPSGRQSNLANVSGNLAKFENQHSSSPDILWLRMSNDAPDNNSQYFVYCSDSSTLRCAIWSDGDIDNHDNSYGGTSDQKLKQQITDASSQWDDIKALQVRKFKFNDDVETHGDSDEHWRLGVIAQEVETAGMSGLVNDRVDKDADGNALETTTKSVKYSVLYMKAVKALQEAMARIEILETENVAIKARLDALETE